MERWALIHVRLEHLGTGGWLFRSSDSDNLFSSDGGVFFGKVLSGGLFVVIVTMVLVRMSMQNAVGMFAFALEYRQFQALFAHKAAIVAL